MPAQKAADDLWSHVKTIQLRTCLPADLVNGDPRVLELRDSHVSEPFPL